MQTISETPAPAPVSEPVPEVKPPTVEETPAPAPEPVEVTMRTIASAPPAPAPEVTMRTVASAPKPPEPDVTAPMRTAAPPSEVKKAAPAAEKKAPSPVADAPQKKSKRGVIVVSAIAVASLVIVSGAIFAAVLMFKGGSSSEPPQNTVPVQPENTNTQPGGMSATIADSTAVTPRSGTNTTPDAGPAVADTARDAGQSAPAVQQSNGSATGTKPALDTMTPGPLRKNQIVLLSDTSSLSRQAKRALSEAFGAEKVSFQEAEGMGSYKQLLKDIVKSDPSIVVLCFAQQYADDGISASGFENVIAFHADQFRENGIPFLFVQPVRDDDDARIRAYIDVTTDLCRQRSISFVSAEDVTGGKLVSLVREDKKAE